ncbi:MAG: GNAT family N-acetyltransferase [Caldilineaceae bacterium]|nr:GNAT family N-acetyltransferase [Caldilineaceae bacterium]
MTIRLLQPGDEAMLERFLVPRLKTSMFLISNLRLSGLVDTGKRYTGTYAATIADGQITGVMAHYWNGNLMVQAPHHTAEELAALCHTLTAASRRDVAGLLGPGQQTARVRAGLPITPENIKLDEVENLYSLTLGNLQVPDALKTGRLQGRRIEARDLEIISRWSCDYAVEALGDAKTPALEEHSRDVARRALDERRTWLVVADGQPVAMSSFNAWTDEAVQIGGVWTPPALRGRGFARAAVAASLLDARTEGRELAILFTGKEMLAAQRTYAALGFQQIGEFGLLLLHQPISFSLL